MPPKNNPPKDPLKALRELLLELNLTTLARELPTILAKAEEAAPAYSEFLQRALEAEQAARLGRKIDRRLRWSRLGACVSLDAFDFSVRPQLSPQAVRELATCRFVAEKRNVILVGRPSLGKTTVAKAFGVAACEQALSVYYTEMTDMLASLHAARADGTYRKAFRRVTQPDLLIIDEAGFCTLGREATNELFRVVCARYQQRSTVVVTNLPSPEQAVAIADRLIDQATILRFTGKRFRNPREIFGAPLEDE